MIVLAYDGSINGDWVARYAMRLAANAPERALTLVHVRSGEVDHEALAAKLRHITDACARLDVALEIEIAEPRGDIAATLAARVPAGGEALLVCGARLRGGRRGHLAGTVSQQLLRHPEINVLAVRCVQPGLLGDPHEILWPLRGHPEEVEAGIPFVQLLAPGIRHLQLLRVVTVGQFEFRRLRPGRADELRDIGEAFLDRMQQAIAAGTSLDAASIRTEVRVSDNREQEIVICASRHKSQLILLWAPEASLNGRFLFGDPLEQVMRDAPCDVAVFRGAS